MLTFIIRTLARLLLHTEWQFVRVQIKYILASMQKRPDIMPPLVAQRLLVSGEDRRHGRHSGFDIHAIVRAIFHRFTSSRREGASTIEQQIIRVITNRFDRNLRRKIREVMLASLVASHFPKSDTPALYLTIGYYGWRMNDYLQACKRLGLRPNNLSLEDAAEIVARLKYPEPRTPSLKRLEQISRRKEYLKKLYCNHLLDSTYIHLRNSEYGKSVPSRRKFAESFESLPYA